MKFTTVIALIAAATAVSAASNAQRLARGLSPNAPQKRDYTRTHGAHDARPSGGPYCNGGSVQCCDSTQTYGEKSEHDDLVKLLGLSLAKGTSYGVNCSPLTVIGVGNGGQCNSQTVCCENDHFNGLVNVGCTPINLNL